MVMTAQDYTEFSTFMELISKVTAMPNGKNAKEVTHALFTFLSEYPFDVVKCAVIKHCKENKFFPMLADIVRQIEGTTEERAAMAWALLLKARKKYELRKTIRFPNPAIHFAIEQMGGWKHVYYGIDDENEDFKAKTFETYYCVGEKVANWDNVCSYFISDFDKYLMQHNDLKKLEVYDVETGLLVPECDLPALK